MFNVLSNNQTKLYMTPESAPSRKALTYPTALHVHDETRELNNVREYSIVNPLETSKFPVIYAYYSKLSRIRDVYSM